MSAPLPPAVVFDLDGTLVDSAPGLRDAINAVLVDLGRRPITVAEVHAFIGDGLDMLLRRAFRATGEELAPEPFRARWFEVYEHTVLTGTRPYPGAEELLDTLIAGGCRLGLCTNKPQAPTLQLLDHLAWTRHFEVVLGGDAVPRRKPDPDHVLQVSGRLGPGPAVYVGDSPTDVAAARAAGLPIVLVGHGYSRVPQAELGAERLVASLVEVPDALRSLW